MYFCNSKLCSYLVSGNAASVSTFTQEKVFSALKHLCILQGFCRFHQLRVKTF